MPVNRLTLLALRSVLLMTAIANIAVALLHVIMIFMGPALYVFLGAPQELVAWVRQGQFWNVLWVMIPIALAFFVCGLYALSAAGYCRRMPWQSTVLGLIAVVYCLRGSVVLLYFSPGVVASLFGVVPAWQDWLFSLLWLLVGLAYWLAWCCRTSLCVRELD